jgi:cytochrome c-type biogenesis protein CcmF
MLCSSLIVVSSLILLWALGTRDFSVAYVADYTDSFLPMFYALTAFWAGQQGSFLFWLLVLSLYGLVWIYSAAYKRISPSTRAYFWVFFFAIQAFFLLMLTGVSNPFVQLAPAPQDGSGLNPLLQHPGMIFHPPLLFLGYAGFTIPACLALASWLGEEQESWLTLGRNWVLVSWIFLTAGIILGSWWSYMELGWGGYWAWDPVENASLIPWLSSSAFLHTALLGRQRKALGRSNVLLIGITLILCFFGTYVVRSGAIDSLHAFGEGGVGGPLLLLMLFALLVLVGGVFISNRQDSRPLSGFMSREGGIVLLSWLLLALSAVVLLGTMWPVISKIWSQNPVGVDAGFYNRVCLPLFTLIIVFVTFCPWLSWKSGSKYPRTLVLLVAFFVLLAGVFWWQGVQKLLPLVAASISITACLSIILIMARQPALRRVRQKWGAYGVHLGLALIALGIAFSGAYKQTTEAILDKGQSLKVAEYEVTYKQFKERITKGMAAYQAVLEIKKEGRLVGKLQPERRLYRKFDQPFAEASVLPGLGDELYATLLGFSEQEVISLQVSVNPLVNWIWIGGVIICVLAWLALQRLKKP